MVMQLISKLRLALHDATAQSSGVSVIPAQGAVDLLSATHYTVGNAYSSSSRTRGSSNANKQTGETHWIPAFAGMTFWAFYRIVGFDALQHIKSTAPNAGIQQRGDGNEGTLLDSRLHGNDVTHHLQGMNVVPESPSCRVAQASRLCFRAVGRLYPAIQDCTLAAIATLATLLAPAALAGTNPSYTLYPISTPEGEIFEASAVEVLDDGRVAVALRKGEVWIVDGLYDNDPTTTTFKKIAEALHEPLNLLQADGGLYVVQRSELTHLEDTDGDDVIDVYRTINSEWGITGNYHEYAYGAVPSKDGALWITLNIGMGKANYPDQDAWRGWGVKVYADGHMEPQCAGMRSPAGLGANLEGDVFFTDQQGNWIPAGSLHRLRKGAFYGHVDSLKHCALPGAPFAKPETVPSGIPLPEAKAQFPMLSLPAVWFPYKKVGMSTTDVRVIENDEQLGPFKGQLLVGDFTTAAISRVYMEKVNGAYQGACFNFLDGFQSAVLRMDWGKDGSLFVGESNRGWNSFGTKSFGMDRVTWNGEVPFEIQQMRLEADGFTLRFTKPVQLESATNPASYTMSSYTLMYHTNYGSPEVDTQPHAIQSAILSEDGMEVRLVTDPIRQYYIHEIHAEGIRSLDGMELDHSDGYYTANELMAK